MESNNLLAALQEVQKRAERVEDDNVIATYVDDAPLVGALGSTDNGVIFGRRGTGKTHALRYLSELERNKKNFVVYIDMEQDTGSTEGRYVDQTLSVGERATRLLVDVLTIIHERLLEDAFEGRSKSQIDLLDSAMDHFSEVLVVESATSTVEVTQTRGSSGGTSLTLSPSDVSFTATGGISKSGSNRSQAEVTGSLRHRVHFGALSGILRKAFAEHGADRCWIVLDEWSSVPIDLQPYVGEMLRSILFGIPKVTVRIAAIRHRTEWRITGENGDYVGLEVGAELFNLLDLDDFVVFPARSRAKQTERSTEFFKKLLFRHLNQVLEDKGGDVLESPEQMMGLLFTQVTALEELVRAAEGVPRDALAIVARAALRASGTSIGVPDIRDAPGQLYQTTKATQLNGVPKARALLDAILDQVLNGRKARAFLLLQEHTQDPLIQQLVDDRLLHITKRGYSGKDEPGVRYDVLQIDYGCYVSLLGTAGAPAHLLGEEQSDDDQVFGMLFGDVDVPEDDYRAIRRAILDLPSTLATIAE